MTQAETLFRKLSYATKEFTLNTSISIDWANQFGKCYLFKYGFVFNFV